MFKDNVEIKSQRQKASADTNEHTRTSEKRPCKHLACMATPVKRSRDLLIRSGSPADSQSAHEQGDSERKDVSTTKSD